MSKSVSQSLHAYYHIIKAVTHRQTLSIIVIQYYAISTIIIYGRQVQLA